MVKASFHLHRCKRVKNRAFLFFFFFFAEWFMRMLISQKCSLIVVWLFVLCRRLSVQSSEGHWNEGIHQTAAERTAGRCGEGDTFQTIGDRCLQHTAEGTEALKYLNSHIHRQTVLKLQVLLCFVCVQGAKLTFVQNPSKNCLWQMNKIEKLTSLLELQHNNSI